MILRAWDTAAAVRLKVFQPNGLIAVFPCGMESTAYGMLNRLRIHIRKMSCDGGIKLVVYGLVRVFQKDRHAIAQVLEAVGA